MYQVNINGEIEQWTEEQMQAHLDAERLARMNQTQREFRNMALKEHDYLFLSDTATPSAELIAYRQALRDAPTQEGWPSDVTWPTIPENLTE